MNVFAFDKKVSIAKLVKEINSSTIKIALDKIYSTGSGGVQIFFKSNLNDDDINTLREIIEAHDPELKGYNELTVKVDSPKDYSGREIVRQAVATAGWNLDVLGFTLNLTERTVSQPSSSVFEPDYSLSVSESGESVIVVLSPSFSYEIVGGYIARSSNTSCKLNVFCGVLEQNIVAVKRFVSALDLRLFDRFHVDGKSPKFVPKETGGLTSNRLVFEFFDSPVGEVSVMVEVFRP